MLKVEKFEISPVNYDKVPLFMLKILTNEMNQTEEKEYYRHNKLIQTNIPYVWSEKFVSKFIKF